MPAPRILVLGGVVVVALVGVIAFSLAKAPAPVPATSAPSTSGATTNAPATDTPAATTAGAPCPDTSALKTALDALKTMGAGTTPQADLLAAIAAVGKAATNLITAGASGSSEHLGPLETGADLTRLMVTSRSTSEANGSIQQLLNTGALVLQELGTCP